MNHRSVEFLRDYNDWRREAGRYDADNMASIPDMPNPNEVGEAIDWACEQIERMHSTPIAPDGWQLVPKAITPYMGHAGDACLDDDGSIQGIWSAMLAAAPLPPPPGETK